MSFSRAKITRFNDKSARPATAATSLRQTSSSQKSFIPKFRSLSQPPSTQSIKDNVQTTGDSVKSVSITTTAIEEAEVARDHSVKSDEEFKDCLDVKPDAAAQDSGKSPNNDSRSELGSQATLINSDLKDASTKSEKGSMSQLRTMGRKNSSSGIPISVSGASSAKPSKMISPKVSPRIPHSPSPPARRFNNASQLSNEKAASKKNMELFLLKKKRFEQLKKDVLEKQKPILELYHTLQQLKKKLEENGRPVALDGIKLIECEEIGKTQQKPSPDLSAGGEALLRKVDLDPSLVNTMKAMVQEMPQNMMDLCKTLIDKRNELLVLLERSLDPAVDQNALKTEMEELRKYSDDLDGKLQEATASQEQMMGMLVDKWSQLADNNEQITSEKVKELQAKLKKQEVSVRELATDLQKARQALKDQVPIDSAVFEEENGKLREKISQLEKQVDSERKKYQYEVEKYKKAELTLKTFKSKIKDFDSSKEHYETRITQLSQDYRNAQLKIKQLEKNFEKEIAELNKSRHLDKSVIERLNKDKSTFESRVQTATENQETMRADFEEREFHLMKELEEAKNEAEIKHNEVSQLRKECELLRKQLNALEVQNQQAADVMTRRKDHVEKPGTDRECELQVEIVAQRAAIRALQEKVEANAAEKLRFIETIEKMNGTPEGMNDTIVKSLVKKEEDITKYNLLLKRNDEIMSKQKLEIDTLYAKQENLLNQIEAMQTEGSSDELKHMLKEGKSKLEHALMKSLENEHKIIKYEHELAQKNQAIANLENMMKVRDGLIGVMKAKKDELTMENRSLTKYSEEIRTYVLESKVELREKSEIIQELQSTITSKQKETHKLEVKVQALEQKLAMTNEKRYKLQETITTMEKELQATKAQMNQIEDMQTRYDLGRISDDNSLELQQWNETSVQLYEQYKHAYQQDKHVKQFQSEMNTIHRNYFYRASTLDVDSVPLVNAPSYNRDLPRRRKVIRSNMFVADNPRNSVFGSGKEYSPILFDGVDRYRVMSKGSLLWCQPSDDMQVNNSLIIKDLIAHTSRKVDNTLSAATKFFGDFSSNNGK